MQPPDWPRHDPAVVAALHAAAADGSWGRYHGPHCDLLIDELKRWSGCEYVRLCSSGTAAIELALRALRVSSGDEVILAAYDYAAAFKTVLLLGATPVLVDIDPANCAMDADQLAAALTDQTAAIVVSHLHGGIADIAELRDIAAARSVPILEDACQATGATIGGRRAGSNGTLGVLSFGGSKLLTAGRGGAVMGHDAQFFQRMHLYEHRGNTAYPFSEIQAAILLPQLRRLQQDHETRTRRVDRLKEAIGDLPLIPFSNAVACSPAFYKFGMTLASSTMTAEDFSARAREAGIACDVGLPPLHTIHSKRRFRACGGLDAASTTGQTVLQLHHPVLLESEEVIDQIAHEFRRLID